MTPEMKKALLLKMALRVDDVVALTGYSKRKCYEIMAICRRDFAGRAGILTDAITPRSLCKALNTTLEDELSALEEHR